MARATSLAFVGQATQPPLCWRSPHCRPAPGGYRALLASCRAALSGNGAEWLASDAAAASGGTSSQGRPLSLLDEDLVQASYELQELCRLQLQLLTTALQLSLQAVMTSSVSGSMSDSFDEEGLRQQMMLDSACLKSSIYCRAPASLQTGQLQLQLVASAEGAGGCCTASTAAQRSTAQQAQRFLFLGQDGAGGASLADQERRILEQPVIVLPDSGGLVLPMGHNDFLVGLLVVERCMEEEEAAAAAEAAAATGSGAAATAANAAAAGGRADGGSSSSSSGDPSRMPQPPACLLFRSAELQLLKQTASVLALACAMDLRAALERAGAAYRQRQASALVQAARKPLSVMRTLGTMLLPRLQPGEPDRDFAQGILEQGSRLQEVVSQLQAALHPGAMVMPPPLQPTGSFMWPGQQQQQQQQWLSGGGAGGWQLPEQSRTALPSSTIGGDYQWDGSSPTIDMSIDDSLPQGFVGAAPGPGAVMAMPFRRSFVSDRNNISATAPPTGSSGSGSSSSGSVYGSSSSGSGSSGSSSSSSSGSSMYGGLASADLLNVLMPLLASASNLAAVSGVGFSMADPSSSSSSGSSGSGSGGRSTASAGSVMAGGGSGGGGDSPPQQQQQTALPAAEVAVGPGKLKRMLSQLIDGVIACAARGDLVQASVLPQDWHGCPGVAVTLCCCYSLSHGSSSGGGGGGSAGSAGHLPRPPLQPEFAFLQSTASEAGGWFDVHTEPTPDVRHLNSSALAATLWLPTVVPDASWP